MAHNNVHIPHESWPTWTWYAIEFGIVLAISMIIGWKVSDHILYEVASIVGHGGALDSWAGISVHSPEFGALDLKVQGEIVSLSNWIFYSIFAAVFGAWYLVLRTLVLKKRILS